MSVIVAILFACRIPGLLSRPVIYFKNLPLLSQIQHNQIIRLCRNLNTVLLGDFDLYSVYDQDTLVCVDAKEPLRIAEKWCSEKCNNEGKQVSFYADVKGMALLAMNRENHDIVIQVMGTSFVDNRVAYLPEIPSTALNERLMSLLWMKERRQDPRLLIVVCRDDADSFFANKEVDPYFAGLLSSVKEADIPIEVLSCSVDASGMKPKKIIPFS